MTIKGNKVIFLLLGAVVFLAYPSCALALTTSKIVSIGLNYPKTGPYSMEGLDQFRAAIMATDEINTAGGILGRNIHLVIRDSASNVRKSKGNIKSLIENEGVKMIFGGSSSSVAITACSICQEYQIPFFGTLTYSTATTGEEGHRACFRECYNSWMAAKVLADYSRGHFNGKHFFYITADYTWGWTTEESLRLLTHTRDKDLHQGVLTPLGTKNFIKVLRLAQATQPDVLVLTLFGKDMVNVLRQATVMGLKQKCQIVVPNLTQSMAVGAGPKAMEGVIGALPWTWRVPYTYEYPKGIEFVKRFKQRYNIYPSTSAASAYTILYEYKAAVERINSFDGPAVIQALEGHSYQWTKDQQTWREFDHQSIQTVYLVRGKPIAKVLKDPLQQDFFEILHSMSGSEAARSHEEWQAVRRKAGKPLALEELLDDSVE